MTALGTITDVIDQARACRRSCPSQSMLDKVDRYRAAFDASCVDDSNETLNLFAFHVDVPESHRVINYIDVQHDHGEFDYGKLATHFLWAASVFNQRVRVYFVTNESNLFLRKRSNVSIIRLPTNAAAPMLERVIAMKAYVESRAFSRNTVFLDTDAYPNRDLQGIFKSEFDVGVTYRTTPGFMPINEGVIFCSGKNREAANRFFSSYLGTYEGLMCDAAIEAYYGNITRWRGGQLSLNAVASPKVSMKELGEMKSFHSSDIRIGLFPCNTFNYWVTRTRQAGAKAWDRKFVLHLKGDSKRLIDEVIAYQVDRARKRKSAVLAAQWICDVEQEDLERGEVRLARVVG